LPDGNLRSLRPTAPKPKTIPITDQNFFPLGDGLGSHNREVMGAIQAAVKVFHKLSVNPTIILTIVNTVIYDTRWAILDDVEIQVNLLIPHLHLLLQSNYSI
jgi:hypothetical protein